jgi:uncharacterized protein YndB with AHSA1/START domain
MTIDTTRPTVLHTRQPSQSGQRPITIERTLAAPPEDVWEMWTTKEGLESWWGPERFVATVRVLELRPGGRLEIEMRADDPDVIAWLEAQGQPTTNVHKSTFTEITPVTRLAFLDRFDHAPDVEPYDIACSVTFQPDAGGTRMTFVTGPMHDDRWTQLATAGRNSSFDKLAKALEHAPRR